MVPPFFGLLTVSFHESSRTINIWLAFVPIQLNLLMILPILLQGHHFGLPLISAFQKKQELVHQCDLAVSNHTTQTPYCHFDCLFCVESRSVSRQL